MEALLEQLLASPLVYLLIAGSIAGSAVFPPLPSESMLITAMGLAAAGNLTVGWVAAAVILGGWAGDLLAYSVGRLLSRPAHRAAAGEGRAQAALTWLEAREHTWGPGLIILSRFIPGGTTAVGLSAGLLTYPFRTFIGYAAVGAAVWTGYGALVAYVGNALFPQALWLSLTVAVATALAIGGVAHRASSRRG